jgi:alpha-L-fucosidase
MSRVFAAAALCVFLAAPAARSAEIDMVKRVEELKGLKFGMFIHWSLATFTGNDIALGGTKVSVFNPGGCDTDQWASVAKEADMRYMLFVTKHADGFCLWDTKTTGRKATNSPLGKDVLAGVRKSCDKHGLKLALYYGQGDWTWPGAIDGGANWPGAVKGKKYPGGMVSGVDQGGGSNPEVKKAQLKELLTEYGPVEFIWFEHSLGDGGLNHQATAAFVKSLQPGCFVGFNHGPPAGDLRLGEDGRPARLDDPSGAGVGRRQEGIGEYKGYLAAEFSVTIQRERDKRALWFYSSPENDDQAMPAEAIFRLYQGAVKYGNIFTLDLGPDRAGRLREIDVKTLRKVGVMIRESSTGK